MVPKPNGAHMTKWCPGDSVPKPNGAQGGDLVTKQNGAWEVRCLNEMVTGRLGAQLSKMVTQQFGAQTIWCP